MWKRRHHKSIYLHNQPHIQRFVNNLLIKQNRLKTYFVLISISTSRTSSKKAGLRFRQHWLHLYEANNLSIDALVLLCNCNHISVSVSRLARFCPNMEQEKSWKWNKIYSDLELETSASCLQLHLQLADSLVKYLFDLCLISCKKFCLLRTIAKVLAQEKVIQFQFASGAKLFASLHDDILRDLRRKVEEEEKRNHAEKRSIADVERA